MSHLRFYGSKVDLLGPQVELLHRNVFLQLVGLVVQRTVESTLLVPHEGVN
jgi:hypothetical protein